MSIDKFRSKSHFGKDHSGVLPALRGHAEVGGKKVAETDRYDQYLSAKLDRAVEDPKEYATARNPNKASLILLTHRDNHLEKGREASPVNRLQGTRSTPKLKAKSRSP